MLSFKKILRVDKSEDSSVVSSGIADNIESNDREVVSVEDNKPNNSVADSLKDEVKGGRLYLRFSPTFFYGLRLMSLIKKKPISTLLEENVTSKFNEELKVLTAKFSNVIDNSK